VATVLAMNKASKLFGRGIGDRQTNYTHEAVCERGNLRQFGIAWETKWGERAGENHVETLQRETKI
jgi:hypothetical protein